MSRPTPFVTNTVTDAATGTVTLAVVGEFDAATVPIFRASAQRVLELEPTAVMLDLSDTTLIDSAAIGAMAMYRTQLLDLDVDLQISAPLAYQQRLFEIVGLTHFLTLSSE